MPFPEASGMDLFDAYSVAGFSLRAMLAASSDPDGLQGALAHQQTKCFTRMTTRRPCDA